MDSTLIPEPLPSALLFAETGMILGLCSKSISEKKGLFGLFDSLVFRPNIEAEIYEWGSRNL